MCLFFYFIGKVYYMVLSNGLVLHMQQKINVSYNLITVISLIKAPALLQGHV